MILIEFLFFKALELILQNNNKRNQNSTNYLHRCKENATLLFNRGIYHESNITGNIHKSRIVFAIPIDNINENTINLVRFWDTLIFGYTCKVGRNNKRMRV